MGAGPYGLALAAHLRDRKLAFRIFGRPMDSWLRYMPEGMYLKSEGFASSIADPHGRHTLARFCRESGRAYGDYAAPVSLETFAEYGLWFQKTLVPEVEETEVGGLREAAGSFELALATGETVRARRVVVASGHVPHQYVPAELRDVPAGRVSHSAEHRSFNGFEGKKIAVIGGGQSALETAALLREHGAFPVVIVRRPSISWNEMHSSNSSPTPGAKPRQPPLERIRMPITGLGAGWKSWVYSELPVAFSAFPEATRVRLVREVLGPAGAWWLRDRFEGQVEALLGHSLEGATPENGRVRLRLSAGDGGATEVVIDSIVAATGYRVALERLSFLGEELRARLRHVEGSPALSSHFESSVPGLYFTGLAAANTFGPVMRFVYGTGFAARRVTRHLAKRAQPPDA